MRAMPETDMITLRPMEEFVNHIGVDEFRVFIKILFVWILRLCVFHNVEEGMRPPLRTSCRRRWEWGCAHRCPPHTERTHCFHRKIRAFPPIYQKKANIFPSALPNCRYRLAFRTARLHFSGITLRGTKDEIREKHPHGIAGEKRIRTFA